MKSKINKRKKRRYYPMKKKTSNTERGRSPVCLSTFLLFSSKKEKEKNKSAKNINY